MRRGIIILLLLFVCMHVAAQVKEKNGFVLKAASFKHYVDHFNTMEDENMRQAIPNDSAWVWMQKNIPLFECPQQDFEEIFYYR